MFAAAENLRDGFFQPEDLKMDIKSTLLRIARND